MRPRVLLVQPPIHDFTAFDFWLRPYGLMRVAGRVRHECALTFFDFLTVGRRDAWGRGSFDSVEIPRPRALADIPRRFRRFGRPREEFRDFLRAHPCDAVLVGTSMTYWYPGVAEVIEDVRRIRPEATVVLGGVYATLCPSHARSLGPDLVVAGSDLDPLWDALSLSPGAEGAFIPAPGDEVGVLKLGDGCPYGCTYCAAPLLWPGFSPRPPGESVREFGRLVAAGARHVAFYDDALLADPGRMLLPFLDGCARLGARVSFHTPNALHARLVTPDLARRMVGAGFRSFFLGLESGEAGWQRATGGKLGPGEFEEAVRALRGAGADSVCAYVIVGHPDAEGQDPEGSLRLAHRAGARVLLSEFSPVPGTEDGRRSAPWADLSEPLEHNKTAFATRRLGPDLLDRLKRLKRRLNEALRP